MTGRKIGNGRPQSDPDRVQLLGHLATDLGKHIVRVAPNEPDRANHDYQDDRKHNRVFSDILAAFFNPKLLNRFNHVGPHSNILSSLIRDTNPLSR